MPTVTKKLKGRRFKEVPVVWKIILWGLLPLAYVLGSLVGLGRIDFALTDQLSLLGGRKASDNIVIIGIDDKSIAELGRWPWRRELHTRLLKRLATAQTRSIGMQIIFSEPDGSHPQDDLLLAKQVALTGNVVLPVIMQSIPGKPPAQSPPLPALRSAARAIGHTHLELDSDGLARSVFLREGVNRYQWDHFSLAMYKAAGGAYPDKQLPGARASEESTSIRYPDAWQRDYWIQIPYTSPARGYKHYSYVDVLHGRIPSSELRDRYVLIGAISVGMGDAYATPLSGHSTLTPGVDISANVLDALVQRDPLRRASNWQNGLYNAVPVTLALLTLWLLGTRKGLFAVGALLVLHLLLPAAMQRWTGLQFYPAAGLLCLIAAYPLWSWKRLETVLAYLSDEAEKFRIEQGDRPDSSRPTIIDEVERRMRSLRHVLSQTRKLQRLIADSLDSLPDPTFIADRNGDITRANKIALHYLSTGQGHTLIGESLHVVLSGFLTPESIAQLPSFSHASEPENALLELTSQTGVDYLFKSVARVSEHGVLIGWIVSLVDVHVVREALRQRDEALRFISHDMRAPQTSILSLIELNRRGVDVGGTDAVFQRIEAYARRTLGIAEDFIQLAKAESGKCNLQTEDLQAVLAEAVDLVWSKARERGIRIDMSFLDEAVLSDIDRSLMSRAVMNLLDNAIKFSPDQSVVRCGVTGAGEHWRLWIRDQGRGIPPDELGFLFRKFWRSSDTRKTAIAGVGLGLAFVKLAVAAHHGEVSAYNVQSGGAEFQILLAKVQAPHEDDELSEIVQVAA